MTAAATTAFFVVDMLVHLVGRRRERLDAPIGHSIRWRGRGTRS
ncbi:hypothetical protein [Streptomyces bacillaris]